MNQRDVELLSAYLDGQLKPSDSAHLEARLKTEPELVSVMDDLRGARDLLRKLPQRRAPRNFTLTRKMVGQNPPLPRAYPVFRFSTALATLLFFLTFGFNLLAPRLAFRAPAYGMGGGGGVGEAESLAAQAPTQAPTEAPTEPPVALAPAATQAPPHSEDSARVEATPAAKAGEEGNVVTQEVSPAQPASEAPFVFSAWQIVFAAIAIAGVLIMAVMRRSSIHRWK